MNKLFNILIIIFIIYNIYINMFVNKYRYKELNNKYNALELEYNILSEHINTDKYNYILNELIIMHKEIENNTKDIHNIEIKNAN